MPSWSGGRDKSMKAVCCSSGFVGLAIWVLRRRNTSVARKISASLEVVPLPFSSFGGEGFRWACLSSSSFCGECRRMRLGIENTGSLARAETVALVPARLVIKQIRLIVGDSGMFSPSSSTGHFAFRVPV